MSNSDVTYYDAEKCIYVESKCEKHLLPWNREGVVEVKAMNDDYIHKFLCILNGCVFEHCRTQEWRNNFKKGAFPFVRVVKGGDEDSFMITFIAKKEFAIRVSDAGIDAKLYLAWDKESMEWIKNDIKLSKMSHDCDENDKNDKNDKNPERNKPIFCVI